MPGRAMFVVVPLFLLVFLRAMAAVNDGSRGPTSWLVRIVGWPLGLGAALVTIPFLKLSFSQSAEVACRAVVPPRWETYCEPYIKDVFDLGRWIVCAAILFGVIAVTGGFGGLIRRIRAWEQRRRLAAKRGPA